MPPFPRGTTLRAKKTMMKWIVIYGHRIDATIIPSYCGDVVRACPAVEGMREVVCAHWPPMPAGLPAWALGDAADLDELETKVRLLGAVAAAAVHALGAGPA